MYLPLTGYKEKSSFEEKMSINSVGPKANPQAVNPLDAAIKANQENRKIEIEQPAKQEKQELSEEQKERAVEGFYSDTGMSTQDFMVLRAQAPDETLEVLDKVISKMKENMEEVGEALEAMTEMIEKTSKDNIALQVLQKTLDAMDEASNKDK
tara:strand:+ start:109 stop:567 length:459 start_codon:yes stop_codon:yes gene_type:complete